MGNQYVSITAQIEQLAKMRKFKSENMGFMEEFASKKADLDSV